MGKRSNTPANIRPSTIVTAPRIWVTPSWWRTSTSPRPPKARPSVANTREKPMHEQRGTEQGPSPGGGPPAARAGRVGGRRAGRWPPRDAGRARVRRRPAGRGVHGHAGPVGGHCHPLGRGRLGPLRVGPGHAGHVGQVTGDQRQDAGGQERQRTGRRRDRRSQDQRSGLDQVLDPATHRYASCSRTKLPLRCWPPAAGRAVAGHRRGPHCRSGNPRIYCSDEFSCWFAENRVRSRPVVRTTAGRWPADSSRRGRVRAPPPCAERRSSWTLCPAGPSPVWPSGCGAG